MRGGRTRTRIIGGHTNSVRPVEIIELCARACDMNLDKTDTVRIQLNNHIDPRHLISSLSGYGMIASTTISTTCERPCQTFLHLDRFGYLLFSRLLFHAIPFLRHFFQ